MSGVHLNLFNEVLVLEWFKHLAPKHRAHIDYAVLTVLEFKQQVVIAQRKNTLNIGPFRYYLFQLT